mgnify:CR=1 FL=1
MSKYTRGLLAVILAVVLVLPAAAFAMLPEANARSSTGMDGPTVNGTVVDPDTSGRWENWAAGHGGNKVTTQNVGRIWTDKTVKATEENEESDFLTTLSAMSSTSNSTVTVTTPLDIVMVLDASGSMDHAMGDTDDTKRITALKNAAYSFIDTIAKQNEGIEGVDRQHRVAIVKFSGDKTDKIGNDTYDKWEYGRTNTYNYSQVMAGLTNCSGAGVTDLRETIKAIKPAGATRADNGLQLAEGITSGRADAKKIVVFFTDGKPTSYDEFDSKVANDAVTAAKNMKDSKATVYTIGIFDGADPSAGIQDSGKSQKENKFMQAVSSNYPNATAWDAHGARAENSDYYKSATNAEELKKVFDDISQAITSEAPYPTEIHKGYDETKSGYITFTDELGDFMQVDSFTEVVINGTPFTKTDKTVNKETNTDTYEFTGKAKDLLITVQRAGDDNPQKGDVVTVSIPASLIPLSHFKTVDGKLSVDSAQPIRVKYTSSVKSTALDNLFTPEKVTGLKDYIENNTTVANGAKTVNFYANKWAAGDLGNTVATFEPADTNRYYYFQKQTPIYTDKDCTQPAKNSLADTGTYYYKDEFEEQGENGEAKPASAVIEFIGGDAAKFDGAIVADEDGNLSFSVGTARLAFIDELHTTKESVGGNNTGTATDVLNPKWNNISAKATATHVNSYLGNNGKISYKYDMTPVTVDTKDAKAGFGLTKVLEGRDWTKEDTFEFGLTSENGAPIPESATAPVTASVTKDDLDDKGKAVIDFGTIKYTEPGTYVYRVSEKNAGTTVDGIAYSKNVAEITVTVTPNKKGELSAEVKVTSGKAMFENAYATNPVESSVTDKIDVTKVLTGRDLTAGEFSFELREVKGEDSELIETVENAADGKVTFSPIEYTEIGQHTYTLREVPGDAGNGITYDGKTYTIETVVKDNGDGTLGVEHKLKDVDEAKFNNGYKPNPDEFSVTDEIKVTKVLTGRDMTEGEFSFELVEGEGKDAKVVATGKNAADGTITMSAVKHTKPGKHTYTLREANGGTTSKGITYSDAKYTIETTITDNGDGTLKAEHVLKGTKPAEFKNTYSVTPIDAELDFDLSKAIDGRDWTDADKFSFTITAPEGTPLPDPATVTVSKKDAKDGIAAINFGKISYTAAGTYKYEIRENAGSAAGMTYDGHVATAEVTVTDNGKGVLTANVTKKESGRFTNTYRSELDYAAAGGLKLSKTLSGRPMTEGQFTFTVTPADEASAIALGLHEGANVYKSPATAEATVGLIDILAGHEVKFTQADAGKTFTYTVAEKNDGQPGYTYDDAERTVTIAIADDGAGTLTATTTVSGGPNGTPVAVHKSGENKVESAVAPFVNSYSATTTATGGAGAQIVATKTLAGRPMANGEFCFGIAYAGEKDAIEGTFANNINGQVSFGTLHYTTEMLADLVSAGRAIRTDTDAKLAWTINYTAFEYTSPLEAKGITAATPSFSFKVIVVDNGDGTLTAKPDYGGTEPVFENVYGAEAADAALAGTKKLQAAEGLTPADITGKFTFTVTADEVGAPMPEHTAVTNDAAGNVDFGKIHFTLEDLNRALGVTTDASDDASSDAEANADEAEVDADAADTDESNDESEPAAPTAPRSHTFTYTVTESGSAPGVTNDVNATRKVSYTVTDDGAGHLKVVREGDDGAAFTFTNTYSVTPTDSVVTDQVKTVKRLTGRDLAAGEFTFELLEDDVVVASGTNDVNGNVTLNPIRYEAPGTHTYTLREACPNALGLYKGVTYDGTTYTVVTTVSDNGDGTLTATHKLEGTTESAGFTNKYHAMPTQVSIGAIKVLEGRELKKDEFSFKLVGEDIESTVTNDADGKINFDKFEYDEPGTYVYTISEVKGDEAGMTYDKSVFTATVNVADDGEGNLKANVAFAKGDKSVEGIVFNNTYKKPETPVPTPDPGTPKTVTNIVKTVKGFLPTTGDQQAAALLMAFVIAMAGVGALVWGIRKR